MGEQQKGDHADQPQRHQDFGMGEDHGYSFAAKHTATINPMAIARMPQITLTNMLAMDFMVAPYQPERNPLQAERSLAFLGFNPKSASHTTSGTGYCPEQ